MIYLKSISQRELLLVLVWYFAFNTVLVLWYTHGIIVCSILPTLGVFEKRFAAIIQRTSILRYVRYETDWQAFLLGKVNLKESFLFFQQVSSFLSWDAVTLLNLDNFIFFDFRAVGWCCNWFYGLFKFSWISDLSSASISSVSLMVW